MAESKELKEMRARLVELGAQIVKTSKGHFKVALNGKTTMMPRNAGSYRHLNNARTQLRRDLGVEL
jgi:hypothetical protein